MVEENRNYYRARAEQELTAASRASDPMASAAHRELAHRYQDLADGGWTPDVLSPEPAVVARN